MLRRIQSREPFYDHKKWEEERVRDLQYLKNIRSREVMSLTGRMRAASVPPLTRKDMHAPHTMKEKFPMDDETGDAPEGEPEPEAEPAPAEA
eukprot:4529422-Pyramimonas_sp.AAC.1